jgi:hypothetical protein
MYPFRIFAIRRLIEINPKSYLDLIKYASSKDCPALLRLVILCEFAANYGKIGVEGLQAIPVEMPVSVAHSRKISGMLKAFHFIRTNIEDRTIRSGSDDEIEGYLSVLFCRHEPRWVEAANELMAYKKFKPPVPEANTAQWLEVGDFTPYPCKDRNQLIATLSQANLTADAESVADKFVDWHKKRTEIAKSPYTLSKDEFLPEFINKNIKAKFNNQDDQANAFYVRTEFAKRAQPGLATEIILNSYKFDPELVFDAFLFLSGGSAIRAVEFQMVKDMLSSRPRSIKDVYSSPNAAVFVQLRAQCLLLLLPELTRHERSLIDPAERYEYQESVVGPIFKFFEDADRSLERNCN